MNFAKEAQEIASDLATLRHKLHEVPEIGFDLPKTQALILESLQELPLEMSVGSELSSITAVLRGANRSSAMLLRADMDALPIQEQSGEIFSSTIDGAMHACGHDLHVAMLVGAARILSSHQANLSGDVVFMFQPGEEGWDGAGKMISEGVLNASGQRVSSAYGIHVVSDSTPLGTFTTRPHTMMASSDELVVTVRGKGGHGSAPHTARDPIIVAAQMVGDLQVMISRKFNVFDPVVLTVGLFNGGSKSNIIPDEAKFQATLRSFSVEARKKLRIEILRLCEGIAQAYGIDIDATVNNGYPVTVNDPAHAEFISQVVTDTFGRDAYRNMVNPVSGSEDFSRILEEVPGAYVFLGASTDWTNPDLEYNHSPRVRFSDSVLPIGAQLHAELAVRALQRDARSITH